MQTRMGIRRGFILVGAVTASLVVAACGGKVPDRPSSAESAPTPTVSEMDAWLDRATDPNIPATEKHALVQGSVADPDLVTKVLSLYTAEGAEIDVVDVVKLDRRSIMVDADVSLWSEEHPQEVPFIFEDGKWKIEKEYACGVAALLQLSSRACV